MPLVLLADLAVLTWGWLMCFEKTRAIVTEALCCLGIRDYKSGLKILWTAALSLWGLIFLSFTIGASNDGEWESLAWVPWCSADFYMLLLCVAGYFYAFYVAEEKKILEEDPELGSRVEGEE